MPNLSLFCPPLKGRRPACFFGAGAGSRSSFAGGRHGAGVGGGSSVAGLAFAVVGLAVFLYVLPRVMNERISVLQSPHFRCGYGADEFLRRLPALGASAVQLICGFVLFVRLHKLARWWNAKPSPADATMGSKRRENKHEVRDQG